MTTEISVMYGSEKVKYKVDHRTETIPICMMAVDP